MCLCLMLGMGQLLSAEPGWEEDEEEYEAVAALGCCKDYPGMAGIGKHFSEPTFMRVAIIPIFARLYL